MSEFRSIAAMGELLNEDKCVHRCWYCARVVGAHSGDCYEDAALHRCSQCDEDHLLTGRVEGLIRGSR